MGYQGDAVSFKQAYFGYDGDGHTSSISEYGWQLYPVPNSYSSTTLAEQVNYGYDNDGRVTGIADYGYGGLAYGGGYGSGYGGSYGGTFALEQYSLEYDADSRLYGLSNSVHYTENENILYDADSELANAAYGVSAHHYHC